MTDHPAILTALELDAWVQDRRSRLSRSVRRASCQTLRLLLRERINPQHLLTLAEREIRDPDWRSGFLNRCTIVIRPDGAKSGRLGLWEQDGTICLEAQVGCGVLVLRGTDGEFWFDDPVARRGLRTVPASFAKRRARHSTDGGAK